MSCSKLYAKYDWSVDNDFDDLFITQKTPEHYNGDCKNWWCHLQMNVVWLNYVSQLLKTFLQMRRRLMMGI